MMVAILTVMKYYQLSGRKIISQIRENRHIQYFCNVPDEGLQTFPHSGSICVLRKRINVSP